MPQIFTIFNYLLSKFDIIKLSKLNPSHRRWLFVTLSRDTRFHRVKISPSSILHDNESIIGRRNHNVTLSHRQPCHQPLLLFHRVPSHTASKNHAIWFWRLFTASSEARAGYWHMAVIVLFGLESPRNNPMKKSMNKNGKGNSLNPKSLLFIKTFFLKIFTTIFSNFHENLQVSLSYLCVDKPQI